MDNIQRTVRRYAAIGFLILACVAAYVAASSRADVNQVVLSLLLTGVGFLYAYHVATTATAPKARASLFAVGTGRIASVAAILICAVLISLFTNLKLYAVVVSYLFALLVMLDLRRSAKLRQLDRIDGLSASRAIFFAVALFVVSPALLDFYFNWMNYLQIAYFITVIIYGSAMACLIVVAYRRMPSRTK